MFRSSTLSSICVLTLLPAFVACGGGDDDGGDPDGGVGSVDADIPQADAGPQYSDGDWLFEPDRLLEIEIEMEEISWDTLRNQTRNILAIFGPECGERLVPSPFTYQMATITIEGETVASVGVRKKGFLGSLDSERPSLKVKFNEYDEAQRFHGWKRMTLNNNKQDPSNMNQCLGYELFRAAGVPAPRCNFARVTVNGEYKGIYTHLEPVKKPFLRLYFDDDEGNLYEGTLSDFRDGWTATFDRKTNESVPPGNEDRSDIDALVEALDIASDAQMFAAVDGLVDLEPFYRFWAVEAMVSHWDGYAGNNNNFFIYGDPLTGKFTFMPWGADQLFGEASNDPGFTRNKLMRRLFLYTPARTDYLAQYEDILDNVFDEQGMLDELDRVDAMISDHIRDDMVDGYNEGLAALRANIEGREQRLRSDYEDTGVQDADELMSPLCFDQSGQIDATFDVDYGGNASTTMTLDITINGQSVPLTNMAAFAGADDNNPDHSVIYLTGKDPANRTAILVFAMPDDQVAPGTILAGDGANETYLFFIPEGQQDADEVHYLSGTMTLTSGAPSQGSNWVGSMDLQAWDPPWF